MTDLLVDRVRAEYGARRYNRLSAFCGALLVDLARSDQRRWGEIYVRGLIGVPGRKSVRRISEHVVGARADQGIQQFLNQSPWDWTPIRRNLAAFATPIVQPRAWVVDELVVPKNGTKSVGVARQYAPSVGRMMNCQLGFGVFLAGTGRAVPVNWRLLLPREWDADEGRRAAAHVPAQERHQERWRSVVDAVTEMTTWPIPRAPVVVDARHEIDLASLVSAFDSRGVGYLVRIAAAVPGGTHTLSGAPALTSRLGLAATSMVIPSPRTAGGAASRFVVQPVPSPNPLYPSSWRARPSRLLTEWQAGDDTPRAMWLTNLETARLPLLVDLAKAQWHTTAEMARLRANFGLTDFEGRSFRGWHHHTTLVSLARMYVLARQWEDERGADVPLAS